MNITRRDILRTLALVPLVPLEIHAAEGIPPDSLGLVIHSFAVRGRDRSFADPLRFLDYCRGLGVGAVQVGIGIRDDAYSDELNHRAVAAGIALEGIISLPRDEEDLGRFEAEIRTARRAGATILRSVALTGRRYETFNSEVVFRRFREQSRHRLELSAPIAARHGARLAIENHKDFRASELIELLHGLPTETVGVCLDTGNSIALLEEPHAVVEQLAPLALTTHFKDMAIEESKDGFLLAEVPLGEGFLNLPRIIRTLRSANHSIRFNIEMITRDPLSVPCLSDGYWATFSDLSGIHLARTLSVARANRPARPLPVISSLAADEQLRVEDEHNRRCLEFARSM
jgi:sugar phosphate isomerase/epimerase